MQVLAQDEGPGFFDPEVLNEFLIPFGEWVKQMVFWTDQNLGDTDNAIFDFLGIIRAPFAFFMDLIVSKDPSISSIPWVWVVIAMFLVASFTRNVKVGVMVAAMLTLCGLLGPDYWEETSRTIGMIFVAVLLSAIIGIPLGILSGRFDSVWNVVRPTLDGMQVVHSFVYMLPFVFFWGIGEVSATMVTMVFALPPLVRLTNLGIRQVPEDVVEAARAFGAPESRVLTDVQLPLARPAIMTGLNQTLLLAISMLGIAAIMGASGLGLLVFRAINNSSPSLAASAGLALFLVAVVLDRMTQPEDGDGQSLWANVRDAWAFRKDPEGMYNAKMADTEEAAAAAAAALQQNLDDAGVPAPVGPTERIALVVAAVGGLVAGISVLLPWGNDSGLISGWARRIDQDLAGESFSGLDASGGSWFGILTLAFGAVGVLWAVFNMVKVPAGVLSALAKLQGVLLGALGVLLVIMAFLGLLNIDVGAFGDITLGVFAVLAVIIAANIYLAGMDRAGADGITLVGFGALASALAYALVGQNELNVAYSHGIGVWVAVLGAALLLGGGLLAMTKAPYTPRRPLPANVSWARILGATAGLLLVVIGAFSGWSFDSRQDAVITPEIQQEIDDLRAEADEDPTKAPINASLIQNLVNSARSQDEIIFDGFRGDGTGFGWLSLVVSALAVAASAGAAGLLGGGESRRWQFSTLVAGLGLAVLTISVAWIVSIARVADPRFISGAGAFISGVGGYVIYASTKGVLAEFRRARVYQQRGRSTSIDGATAPTVVDDISVEQDLALSGAGS